MVRSIITQMLFIADYVFRNTPPELELSGRKVGFNSKTLFNLKIENSIWLPCVSTLGETCELHLLLATLSVFVFFVIKQLTDSEF